MHASSIHPLFLAVYATALGSCEMPAGEQNLEPEPSADLAPDASITPAAVETSSAAVVEPEPLAVSTPALQPHVAAPPESAASGACPADMVLIEGKHCPVVDQPCVTWMEDPAKFPYARCAEFAPNPICKAERVSMRYCIDRLEAADETGMPIGDISWTNSAAICKSKGKRLCREREWMFACEGEQMSPYPYGLKRDPSVCNFEKENLVDKGELADYRQPVTANPQCLSPFGVQNMVGNIDEWVVLDKPYWTNWGKKMNSGLKGGWWGPLRNRCRPVTLDHDEYFHELQTGFRCCAEAK
jgi:formylglycine-generating enzyme